MSSSLYFLIIYHFIVKFFYIISRVNTAYTISETIIRPAGTNTFNLTSSYFSFIDSIFVNIVTYKLDLFVTIIGNVVFFEKDSASRKKLDFVKRILGISGLF